VFIFRKKSSLFFLFISTFICNAQSAVTGIVLDKNSTPIPEASIQIIELKNRGTVSDFDGKFSIDLPPGVYTLEVRYIGFKKYLKAIKVTGSKNPPLRVILEEEVNELTSVIVQGKTQAQRIRDKAFEVNVIETKDLKNFSVDINSLLNTIPGVVVRENGGLGSGFNFSLNGFTNNQVKFFINGIPQDNLGTSLTFNNFPATLIERVEIYKGVIPIYLGADALGGAINVITNQKKETFLDVSYDIGSFNTHRTTINGNYYGKNGLVTQVMSFFNYSDNDYTIYNNSLNINEGFIVRDELGNPTGEVKESTKRFHDAYQSGMIQARVGWVDKAFADDISIGITSSFNKKEIQHSILPEIPFGEVITKENVLRSSLIYKKDSILNIPLKLKVYGEIAKIRSKVIDTFSNNYNWFREVLTRNDQTRGELGTTKTLFTFNDRRQVINTSLQYKITDEQTVYFNYTKNHLKRKGEDPVSSLRSAFEDPHYINKNILGLSYEIEALQKKWKSTIFSKLFLTSVKGLIENEFETNETTRFTNYENTSQELGYGIASSIEIIRGLKAKASYEKTFRIPEGIELFGDGLLFKSNPFLKPEQSNNINVGVLWNTDMNNLLLNIDVNAFFRDTKNLFFLLSEGVTARYINLAKTKNMGLEGELSIRHNDQFFLTLNTTYQNITDSALDIRVANRPFLFGNISTGYTFKNILTTSGQLSISWNTLFTEEFPLQSFTDGNPDERLVVPQQLSHNLQLGYSLGNRYHLSIQARNITDARLYDNIAVQKPGRAFYLKLRYFFKDNKSKI